MWWKKKKRTGSITPCKSESARGREFLRLSNQRARGIGPDVYLYSLRVVGAITFCKAQRQWLLRYWYMCCSSSYMELRVQPELSVEVVGVSAFPSDSERANFHGYAPEVVGRRWQEPEAINVG